MITGRTLKIVFLLSASALMEQAQTDSYWLIRESKGTWQYRIGYGEPRQLTGKYDCLRPDGEVRCMDNDVRNCELRYLIDRRTDITEKLPVKILRTGRWVSLKDLKPPSQVVLSPSVNDLVAKFARIAQKGGSRDGSVCGGDLALKAPACGDTVDVADFAVRWRALGRDGNQKISVLVERADGQAALFRGTGLEPRGRYAEDKLLDFLKKLQGRNDVVDITIRVMGENGRNAVRLVHIPPSIRMEQYQSRIREIESSDAFLKGLQLMSLAMDEGMWSKAAEEARRLMDLAPGSVELQEYALAGLCQSDFEEEKIQLRRALPKLRYEGICTLPASTGGTMVAGTPQLSPQVGAASRRESGKTRLGIALLIGNWDYWSVPLNSVRSDLNHMSETLETIGFQVMIRENLRDPKQFQEALAEVLKKQNAGPEDILLVYYSGHGLQLDGKAHLLGTGVSATARVSDDVRANAQSAEGLLAEMERAVPGTRILIIEACRNNLFAAPSALGGQTPRAGFAFQQDDVPNTFVMFANRPGLPTPVRSDYGLMGPFTESVIHALQNSSGEIQEVFALAEKKTTEISPGQEPVIYLSKKVDRVVIRLQERKQQTNRAAELLNASETLYRDKAWDEFRATVNRARVLALDPALKQRLSREVEFVRLVISAEKSEHDRNWEEAALYWQKSSEIFPARQWLGMRAAVAWLMADRLKDAVRTLAGVAQGEGQFALQAHQILGELLRTFPELEAEASKKAPETKKSSGREFELAEIKE